MKKLFIILTGILIIPISVQALDNDFTTVFDENECKLYVEGTESGHEATVSLFKNNQLSGFKTDTIENNKFKVEFTLTYDTPTKIDITVADELGTNEINKTNIEIPSCSIQNNPSKVDELFDNNNSIIIKDKNIGFNDSDYLEVTITSDKEIKELLESLKDTNQTQYNNVKEDYNKILSEVGSKNTFEYYIEAIVRNNNDEEIDYSDYNKGFILNLYMPKDVYKEIEGFKFTSVEKDTFKFIKEFDYEYDKDNEILTVNIEKPGAFIAYMDNTVVEQTKETNPNTGDTIVSYIIILLISSLGITGTGIYLKKKFS